MTLDEIAQEAADRIHAAYWSACDEARRAIDPSKLTTEQWVEDMLAESYDIAMRIDEDPLGWEEGRAKF